MHMIDKFLSFRDLSFIYLVICIVFLIIETHKLPIWQ